MDEVEPERVLYLAIRDVVFQDLFQEPIGEILLRKKRVKLVVFNAEEEQISKWMP